jgi:uncharacterized protein YgbK (DUF1537 family)
MPWSAVADDLTGAADFAGQIARPGVAVSVGTSLAALRGVRGPKVLDAATRFLDAPAARRAVERAWRSMDEPAGAQWRYQKIDSTLRGNPGAEIEGFLQATGAPWIAVLPAYPSLGRQVLGGTLRVHGRPLLRTEYARDPLSPAREERVSGLFQPGLSGHAPLRVVRRGSRGLGAWLRRRPARARFISFDCGTEADVQAIADACLSSGCRAFAGASALGAALAVRLSGPSVPVAPPPLPWLFLLGSLSQSAFAQLSYAQAEGLLAWCPVYRPDGRRWSGPGAAEQRSLRSALKQGRAVALSSFRRREDLAAWQREGRRRHQSPEAWAEASLRRLIRAGLSLGGARPVLHFAAGGHTLSTLLEARGLERLQVLGTIATNVPLSLASGPGGNAWVASRPGGFGAPSALAELLQALRP